jgi:hypothetical protein
MDTQYRAELDFDIIFSNGGLGALPGSAFRFTAVPPKVARFGTFPVRAYATWVS